MLIKPKNHKDKLKLKKDELLFEGYRILIESATEPGDVIWKNMNTPDRDVIIR